MYHLGELMEPILMIVKLMFYAMDKLLLCRDAFLGIESFRYDSCNLVQ